jgi:hypothetical protein
LGDKAGTYTVEASSGTLSGSPVTFTATGTAGPIATFTLSDPGPEQEAGVSFDLTVTSAVDSFGNPTSGTVTVGFADGQTHQVPNGESPTLSDITVTNGSGSAPQVLVLAESGVVMRGTSGSLADDTNPFTVNAGPIQNFSLSDPGTQTAGVGFVLQVENARDGFNNPADGTVTVSFADGGSHNAPNGDPPTLSPITVTSGSGSAQQTLVLAESGAVLRGTASVTAATDDTNPFTVNAAAMNSFVLNDLGTQIAGVAFNLTVSSARDAFNNMASGTVTVSFSDGGNHDAPDGTIPTLRDIIVTAGTGSAQQVLVRAETGLRLLGTGGSATDNTSPFTVDAGALKTIQVQDQASGNTSEVTTRMFNTGEQFTVHAAGFDVFENYREDVTVNWTVFGNIGTVNPTTGQNTIFTATTPGTGVIQAVDGVTGFSDATGTITVTLGQEIDHILVRDAPNNGGNEVAAVTITADDSLTLFAAGYDAQNNFLRNVSVTWSSPTGTLAPPVSGADTSFTFRPTTAPASGVIRATHQQSGSIDSTGTITVNPGNPVGNVTLTPTPPSLPADGSSTSQITSSQILDSDGNPVGANRFFTVVLSDNNLGTITTPDAAPGITGLQVATNGSSALSFQFKAGTVSGSEEIFVSSADGGSANGQTTIAVGTIGQFLLIASTRPNTINTSPEGVGIVNTSQPFGIDVRVTNGLSEAVLNVKVRLSSDGSSVIQSNEITIPRISDNSSETITFNITAASTENLSGEEFTAQIIEGTRELTGGDAPIGTPIDNNAFVQVQTPASLRVQFTKLDPFQTVGATFQVEATVTNLGQAEVDNSGELRLTLPSGYTFVQGSTSTQGFTVASPVQWNVQAPNTPTGSQTFTVQISTVPKDKNINSAANVETSSDSRQVQTLDIGLAIQDFSIVDPPGATDDTLSTEQRFRLRVSISVSENIDSVRADLTLPQDYDLVPGFNLTQILPVGQNQANWEVDAPDQPHNPRPIRVRMRGFDKGQVSADTTAEFSVVAVFRANMDFDNFQGNPTDVVRLSVAQQFQLTALVNNTGQAAVTGPAELTLNLGSTGITSQEPLTQTFVPDVPVVWNVTAPNTPTPSQSISVTLSKIPLDENTNDQAAVNPPIVRTIQIETGEVGGISIDAIFVSSPQGAEDGIISTDQQFSIVTDFSWQDAVDLNAKLVLPTGYQANVLSQDLTSQSGEQTLQWIITAPVNPTPQQFIKIEASGKDASNPELEISAAPDSLPFTVVAKAQLNLSAEITAPQSAMDRILTVGQLFTITVDLENTGQAGLIGTDSLKITLPSGYSTSEPRVKSILPGGQITWQIRAPDQPTGIVDITIEVVDRNAMDENTNQLPPLSPLPPRVKIPVSTESVGLNASVLTGRKPTTVARGATDIPMFGLKFVNSSDTNIQIQSIKLRVKDNEGADQAPNSVLSRLAVVDYFNPGTVFQEVAPPPANNPIQLDINPAISVLPNQSQSIEFRVDIASQTTINNFQLSIDSPQQDILAVNIEADTAVTLRDSLGFVINSAITSGFTVLVDADLEASFFNFPNPFGQSSRPITRFNYNLTQDSDVTIRIYTLLGELVWSKTYGAAEPEGKAGNHPGDIFWDGTNDQGQKVLNGVYVAVLTTNTGKAITKIAIAK